MDLIPSTIKIAFASDDFATLFINGEYVATKDNWVTSSTYCIPLQPFKNVIAFNVTNDPNPGGLLVTAEITYTDGTTSSLASDETWRVTGPTIPDGWEQLSFDDSSWALTTRKATYPSTLSHDWDNVQIAGSDPVSFASASWIWTNDLSSPGGSAPVGAHAFRRTVILPPGHTSADAEVLIVVDNEYSLYINGQFIGSGTAYTNAQRFAVDNIQVDDEKIEIAVFGRNTGGPAGVLVSMQITSKDPSSCLDCSSVTYIITDEKWKVNKETPDGFEQPGFDDSAWSAATVEGKYGMGPWGSVSVPSATSPHGATISGAPPGN
ncbi:hypothetical protein VKT23_018490 [Stygiomarasmius scandens]|uniref:Lectin n=1 Tax=Marasmiellus scandens TaxID=2682957 RepID=A0ABR1INY8_9AGAR